MVWSVGCYKHFAPSGAKPSILEPLSDCMIRRMRPRFFPAPAAFRKWLAANHAKTKELWVGFYRKGSGNPSITWVGVIEFIK